MDMVMDQYLSPNTARSDTSEILSPRGPNIVPPSSPLAEHMDVVVDQYFFNDNDGVDQHLQADPPSPSSINTSRENPEPSTKMQHPVINGKLKSCN
jgi:hypothetical protein